jgi:SAM-dependent methyltransferase
MTRYIVSWRLKESFRRIEKHVGRPVDPGQSILMACAGEGGEASICCDLGFTDVTFSDLSSAAVKAGMTRDARLKGVVLDAENLNLPDNSVDIVIVQDGLHHLPSPTRGFTEMMRVARVATIFMEPHDSFVGAAIGTKWERNGDAINYVFRWTKRLVGDIASSYLGQNTFDNLSFSYWHHNVVFAKVGRIVGAGANGRRTITGVKYFLDHCVPLSGNQFSGIVLKNYPSGIH